MYAIHLLLLLAGFLVCVLLIVMIRKERKELAELRKEWVRVTSTRITIHRDWKLVPVFIYSNGKCDWNVYKQDADYGRMIPSATLEEAKEIIDEITETV